MSRPRNKPKGQLITIYDMFAMTAMIGVIMKSTTYSEESHIAVKIYDIAEACVKEKIKRESERLNEQGV